MEEVDQIILHSLLGIGCEFAEGLKSLKQLSTENVVEGAVKCIRIINPDFKMSHIFPPGMSARFRVGTSIAQACQSLGYRGEIGYQTFLYSSEVDIRKFFMFLIEKLPRKEGITEDTGSSTVLQRRIGQVLRDQSRLMWLPPYCKLNKTDTIPFRTETIIVSTYKKGHESGTPFVHEQICERCHLSQSLMELNIQQLLKAQSTQSKTVKTTFTKKGTAKESFQWRHKSMQEDRLDLTASFEDVIKDLSVGGKQSNRSRFVHTQQLQFSEGDLVKSLRPAIPKKPQKLKKPEPDAKSGDSFSSKTKVTKTEENDIEDVPDKEIEEPDETEEEGQQRKESQLTEALKVLELKQVEYKSEIGSMESSLKQMKIEINELKQATDETEKTIDVQKKTCMLLPNANENMEKLKKLIEKNSQRLLNLARMWEEKRVPLINELRGLRDKTNISEDDTQMKLEEIKLIRKKMKESSDETKRKELIIKQLTVELESMKRDISRQSYTKRILEIVSSIHKQQEEIGRVISEIKDVQKQINKMKGRIDRTFTAVDEAMFKDAKKDEHVRQAYKHLVALHDNCSELLRTVDETGSILREIRELEDQIETESDKNAEENLAKIMKDYKEIKKENADLIKKIRKQ